MKKVFIVAKGTIGGFGGRYFKKGEQCTSEDFSPRVSDSLIKSGHLEIVKEDEKQKDKDPEEFDGLSYEGKTYDEHSKTTICDALTALGVEFKKSNSKSVLFNLLISFEGVEDSEVLDTDVFNEEE